MAKVIAPFFSLTASGDLAKALTYRRVLANNVVSDYARPTDRRSNAQAAHRTGMLQARTAWRALLPSERGSWNAQAAGFPGISGYNLFIRYYLHTYYQEIKPLFDTRKFNQAKFC
ncbi:hypothetical protein JW998_08870 [candidate division KSB1 bacterium]|nr:hypothetical protein [candidate division KSB1 bacterium]